MLRYFSIVLLFGLLNINLSSAQQTAQAPPVNFGGGNNTVKWYSLEEAEALAKKNPRPIFIDTYTHWCGWCKHLDRTTFVNPQIVQYLNNFFYPVKLNAEMPDTVTFRGKEYVNRFTGKTRKPTHDVAIEIFRGTGRMSYPTVFLYDSNFENKLPLSGYRDAKTLLPFLVYYHEQQYGKSNINDYYYFYMNANYGDTTNKFTGEKTINWMTMEEAFAANKKDPSKKIMVQVYHDFCQSCKIMDSTNFKHPELVDYINENYYAVKFDALSKEEFTIGTQKFINSDNGSKIHDFVLSIVPKGQTFSFPITLVFKNDHELIDRIPSYLTPMRLEVILHFYAENANLTQKFVEYMKTFQYKTQ